MPTQWDMRGGRDSSRAESRMEDVDKLLKKDADAFQAHQTAHQTQQTALRNIILQERTNNAGLNGENRRLLAENRDQKSAMDRIKNELIQSQTKLKSILELLIPQNGSAVELTVSTNTSDRSAESSPHPTSAKSIIPIDPASSTSSGLDVNHISREASEDLGVSKPAARKRITTKLSLGRKRKLSSASADEDAAEESADAKMADSQEETTEEAEQRDPDYLAGGSKQRATRSSSGRGKRRTLRPMLGLTPRGKPRRRSNSPRVVAPPEVITIVEPIAELDSEHKGDNDSSDGSVSSEPHKEGSAISIMLPFSGVGKMPCPLQDHCIEDYAGAVSVLNMEQHFQRAHLELTGVSFVLQCHECQAIGFDNHIPSLKAHIALEHQPQPADDAAVDHEDVPAPEIKVDGQEEDTSDGLHF